MKKMKKIKKCLICGEQHFLETFTIPWWSEIVAKNAKGDVLIKWGEQLVCREITLCSACSGKLAILLREIDEQLGGKLKDEFE